VDRRRHGPRRRRLGGDAALKHYLQGLGATLRHNQVAYAFSVMATATFGVLAKEDGSPGVPECFLFIAGAGAGFAIINVLVTRAFTQELADEPSHVVALATALSFFSTGGALGAATLVAWLGHGWFPWIVAPFAGTVVFIASAGAEMGIAGWKHGAGGVDAPGEEA
jgi:hypothetical protein